jgi:DNA ligase-associated metallophosphoesterase
MAQIMTDLPFQFRGETLHALPTGALYWPRRRLLCVSDLHLGKSDRMARRGGPMLPPYETRETLDTLGTDLSLTDAREVICLGDSFDDLAASRDLATSLRDLLLGMMAGRRWIWILGNHDPGPVDLGGTHLSDHAAPPLMFRHIAEQGAAGEVSGHYHPKARISLRGRAFSRRCFLLDRYRLILPAYGTYTGGMASDRPELTTLMDADAEAILLGPTPVRMPMPRGAR